MTVIWVILNQTCKHTGLSKAAGRGHHPRNELGFSSFG